MQDNYVINMPALSVGEGRGGEGWGGEFPPIPCWLLHLNYTFMYAEVELLVNVYVHVILQSSLLFLSPLPLTHYCESQFNRLTSFYM